MSTIQLPRRPLGSSGISVSIVGLGAGQIGGDQSDSQVSELLHAALDAGINLIDTAPSYGNSEERIGRILRGRRAEFILSTKGGYGAPDAADWTPQAITNGIDAALRRMGTEQLDIFHLHSCPLETLQNAELLRALADARQAGKIRVAAYSGENEALAWAIESGQFGCVQTSVNLADQRGLERYIPSAVKRGIGVLAKRPLANLAWRFFEQPFGQYAEPYWLRLRAMGFEVGGDPSALHELALRFSAFAPGVSAILLGTSSLAHLRRNLELLRAGPLPTHKEAELRARFAQHAGDWPGQI